MSLLVAACAGLVIAWRWPLIGEAIFTGGMPLFFAVEAVVTGSFPKGARRPRLETDAVVRKAGSIVRRGMAANRLYGMAYGRR